MDGTVQQIEVRTIGGVVTLAQLMVVVPKGSRTRQIGLKTAMAGTPYV